MKGQLDADLHTLRLDTMLAAYLLDPAESRYLLADLLLRYAGFELPMGAGEVSGGALQLDLGGDQVVPSLEASRRALAVARLVDPITSALDAQGLRSLHDDIEVPLVRVLARMEDIGVGVDAAELKHLNDTLAAECADLTRLICEDAGEEFNVNSTLKLREILFDRLGLQPQKKTKTGYSTDAASLEKLAGQHPIVDHLLRYREVEKLRSTYGEGLLGAALMLVFERRPRLHLTRRLPLIGKPYGIAADPVNGRLWVTLTATNTLVELADGARPHRLRTLPAVRQPDGVAVDPRTRRVFVSGRADGVLQIVDGRDTAAPTRRTGRR